MLVRGGRVIDPASGIDGLLDVRLADGLVREIGQHLAPIAGEEIVDATGAFVAPGFVDMHVHLRDPGFPAKETLATGSQAAARGGFTSVACMPNTEPALDSTKVITELIRRANAPEIACRIYPVAAMTRGRLGIETLDYAQLAGAGAVAFSDDGSPVNDDAVMRAIALQVRPTGRRVVAHAEDEDPMVVRDLTLARETGTPWHIAHVSTAASAAAVNDAKRGGIDVTCEVTPHHLLLTQALVQTHGGGAKVNPPLRTEDDARALREAVRRGEIDAFATDHAPHTAEEKARPFDTAAMGFTGLEVAVGAYALAIPDLPVVRFIELLSVNPARILGVPGGSLAVGSPADLTIFADRPWTVRASTFASKGKNTPFDGMRLPRMVVATIVAGSLRYRAEGVGSA
jgi:dihydroorotase